MGFGWGGVWGMGYRRFMGYAIHFPENQLGGHKMLWDKRGYGLSEVWVKRGLTVYVCMTMPVYSNLPNLHGPK